MAASNAITGYGAILSVETAAGSGIYQDLAELTDVTQPNAQVDQVEVTHMLSPARAKEYKAGLADYGDAVYKVNYVPGSATDTFIIAWRADGSTRSTRLTYPNAHTQTFPSFVKGYAPDAFNPSSALKATLTVKVAGAVVEGP